MSAPVGVLYLIICSIVKLLPYSPDRTHDIQSNFSYPPSLNLLKPTAHVIHQLFNIQQLYVLSTLYLCVLYLSENKQRLVPLTA